MAILNALTAWAKAPHTRSPAPFGPTDRPRAHWAGAIVERKCCTGQPSGPRLGPALLQRRLAHPL